MLNSRIQTQLDSKRIAPLSPLFVQILTLVLDYEATERQAALIVAQLNNHQIILKAMEIDYRFGGSSTDAYLAAVEKQERLENQLIQTHIEQQESLRKILSLTGFDSP